MILNPSTSVYYVQTIVFTLTTPGTLDNGVFLKATARRSGGTDIVVGMVDFQNQFFTSTLSTNAFVAKLICKAYPIINGKYCILF